MKYNYRDNLYGHFNCMRSFALGDEAVLLMADYPKDRPKNPFPYFSEVMTGFEYTAAVGMLYEGQTEQGLRCIKNIRDRYDGARAQPLRRSRVRPPLRPRDGQLGRRAGLDRIPLFGRGQDHDLRSQAKADTSGRTATPGEAALSEEACAAWASSCRCCTGNWRCHSSPCKVSAASVSRRPLAIPAGSRAQFTVARAAAGGA